MNHRDEGGGAAIVISIIVILLLLLAGGGAGVYFVVGRHYRELAMQAERAHMAEAEARMQAELARAQAEAAAEQARAIATTRALPAAASDSIQPAVESLLNAQREAWNSGDIDAFMEHYWKSDELTFSSGGKTTRGWTATLGRYRERYPTKEKMGQLTFSELEVSPLGDTAALVLGRWQVERDSEPLSGNFSLVVRHVDGRWVIIHDHTSRLMEGP